MKFRPCIDIHNGSVKQIVGGSLTDKDSFAEENFVSEYDGAFYSRLYKSRGLSGGHIILLNPAGTEHYENDLIQARGALAEYPCGLQIGGGVNADNAKSFIEMGASHVIVTSYVFCGGVISFDRIKELGKIVGKERLVLDLSCRRRDGKYYIVTDRWQKFTDVTVSEESLDMLASYCGEFLVHAVDAEGKAAGIEEGVARLLGTMKGFPVTYAGGIGSYEDIHKLEASGKGRVDFTVGSALDIFGGRLEFDKIAEYNK